MRIRNKIWAIVLSMVMSISAFATAFADEVALDDEEFVITPEQLAEQQAEDASDDDYENEIAEPVVVKEEKVKVLVSEETKVMLESVGVLTDKEMSMDAFVSRGFAAEVILRLSKIDTTSNATGTMYTDVPEDESYAYSIEEASKMGYFCGVGNGLFDPNSNIKDVQMANILMKYTGYNGVKNANQYYAKLFKNVSTSDDLTYKDLANMLYNALNLHTINLKNISGKYPTYTIDSEKTIFQDWFNTATVSGVVIKNSRTGLYSETNVSKGKVVILTADGEVTAYTGKTNIDSAIGRYVNAYCKADEKDDTFTCLGYDVAQNKNNITEISFNNIYYDEIEDNKIKYLDPETGKDKKVKISPEMSIIYNGTFYSDADFSFKRLMKMEGKIAFIDNDDNGVCDVADIEAYNAYAVKSVVLSNKTINMANEEIPEDADEYMPRVQSFTFEEGIFDECSLVNGTGIQVYLEDFSADYVVSIASNSESAKYRIAKLVASDNTVSAVVSSVEYNDLQQYIIKTEDGGEYPVLRNLTEMPSPGDQVKLHITALGNVAKIEHTTLEGFNYGLLVRTSKMEGQIGKNLYVKIINSDEQFQEFTVTGKIKIDGQSVKNPETAYDMLNSVTTVDIGLIGSCEWPNYAYPIRYRVKEDGILAEIDTPHKGDTETVNSLTKINNLGDSLTIKNCVLGLDVPLNPSATVIMVESSGRSLSFVGDEFLRNTDYTTFTTVSALADKYLTSKCYAVPYKVDPDSIFADLLVIVSGQSSPNNISSLYVIDKVISAYDEDAGMVSKKIVGYREGVPTELLLSENISETLIQTAESLKKGDVILAATDIYGKISDFYVIAQNIDTENDIKLLRKLKDGDGKDMTALKNGKLTGDMIYGFVIDRQDDFIYLSYIPFSDDNNDLSQKRYASKDNSIQGWIRIPSTVPVVVYDEKEDKVYAGTYDEILENCRSVIGLRYRSSKIMEAVVFNR